MKYILNSIEIVPIAIFMINAYFSGLNWLLIYSQYRDINVDMNMNVIYLFTCIADTYFSTSK